MIWLSVTGTVASKPSPDLVIAMPVVQPSPAKSPRSETEDALPRKWIVVVQVGTGGQAGPSEPASVPASVPPVKSGSCDDGQPARTTRAAAAANRIAEPSSSRMPGAMSTTIDSCCKNGRFLVADRNAKDLRASRLAANRPDGRLSYGHASCSARRPMRRASALLILALSASRAWAQGAPPGEPAQPDDPPARPLPTHHRHRRQMRRPRRRSRGRRNAPTRRGDQDPAAEKSGDVERGRQHPASRPRLPLGSYGRVLAGSDLRGGKPEKVAIVAHAPRIVEAELPRARASRTVSTSSPAASNRAATDRDARVRRHAVPRHRRVRRASRAAQRVSRRASCVAT